MVYFILLLFAELFSSKYRSGEVPCLPKKTSTIIVRRPVCTPLSNTESHFPSQPLTTATDTVCPLTPSLFGQSRATSPHGIINQPQAKRLDRPPVTFGLTRFPSAICLWLTMPRPLAMTRGTLSSQQQQHKPPLFGSKDPSELLIHILGAARLRGPTLGWLLL